MSVSRKDALRRLRGLEPTVREHLIKIESNPGHRDRYHWIKEVQGWLAQMKGMIQHVGKKTSAEWQTRLDDYQERLQQSERESAADGP